MRKRLIVTGYGGFVAGSVVRQAGGEWDAHVYSRSKPPAELAAFRCWQLDLCDTNKLRETFREVKPDAVVHAAALADIDYCQSHQEEAEQINVNVTRELARLCGDTGTKLVFCSTDSVFDGKQGMYSEADPPNPVNFYAETKIRAEQAVREYAEFGVVTRLSLVMGLSVLGSGNSFMEKLTTALEDGREVSFPMNEIRTPIDIITLGQALTELAANDFTGTLHLAGETRLNRYEMGCRIAQRLGYATSLIVATDSNAMKDRAPRPNDASLNNSKTGSVLETPMKTMTEGLELVLASRTKQKNE